MGRKHWMKDRVKIARRKPTLEKGVVENLTRGIVEERPLIHKETDPNDLESYEEERSEASAWIPARLRSPGGSESETAEVKVDLGIQYELVLYGWDEHGTEICPQQHDEFIVEYSRDGQYQGVNGRLRIVGTINEIRKRSRLYSYVMPVILYTEF
jgi:hypothetical protein